MDGGVLNEEQLYGKERMKAMGVEAEVEVHNVSDIIT